VRTVVEEAVVVKEEERAAPYPNILY